MCSPLGKFLYTRVFSVALGHPVQFLYCIQNESSGISTPIAWWDRHVVDGFFDFLAWATNATSDEIRGLQSGQVQQYAYVFLCGALALILLLVL